MHHYQRTAWGHFTVRRLERLHGEEAVRTAWGPPIPGLARRGRFF
jgi:hypothetical protein